MSLWYVQGKLCTYPVSRLALSPNRPNKAPPDRRHLGVPSGASKTIYEPMVHLMQIEHLSCTDANTVSKQFETRFHITHVTYEFHRVPPILFLSLRYVDANRAPILHQESHYLQMDQTELPLEPRHLGVPSSASKMISMPMVCSEQTMHLSCTNANTVSKQIETRFHMTHVT
jgi:hypothetical protein